jgi:hypothetical protein
MNIRNLLSQWFHNTNVKDNLTVIVLEKKLENVGRVCETNTGRCLDAAGVTGSNPVAPTISQHTFFLCHNRVTTKGIRGWQ